MDIFNKKKVAKLELEIAKLSKQLDDLKLTKDELKFINFKKELSDLKDSIDKKNNEIIELDNKIVISTSELDELISLSEAKRNKIKDFDDILSLDELIQKRKLELSTLDEEELYQSFGLHTPRYNFMDSESYRLKLEEIRTAQKNKIKNKTALSYSTEWTLGGSKSKGKAMNNDNMKMVLRAFNNECEAIINKVKFNNVEKIKDRILKSAQQIDKLNERNLISINQHYIDLKIDELYLAYEFEVKKQEEKEEQQRIKEQMREEAKALKEIEAVKRKIEKEEIHFINAIKELELKLNDCAPDDKSKLIDKLNELRESLTQLEKDKQDIENREKNTRAGYVYIISNIGSFGENVYKIGMTRRLEPNDRVRELGDASVPFQFDVHAMIFSEDAPTLENKLHKRFAENSVNKINLRKEFFNVSLDEIELEVKNNHNEVIQFTKIAEASEYRQSLQIKNFS